MPHIRASRDADMPAVTDLYAHYVRESTATFEVTPPTLEDMCARRADVLAKGLPFIVIEEELQEGAGAAVVGYAYAQWFKPRPAYRFSAEISIYLSPAVHRRGYGRLLLQALIDQCEAAGLRKLISVIGDSGNAASIGLHAAMGFSHVGTVKACGWKFERWLDIVMMERFIGEGDTTPPAAAR